jgi:hypothetical protein
MKYDLSFANQGIIVFETNPFISAFGNQKQIGKATIPGDE